MCALHFWDLLQSEHNENKHTTSIIFTCCCYHRNVDGEQRQTLIAHASKYTQRAGIWIRIFQCFFFFLFSHLSFFSLLQRSSNCELTVLLKIFAFAFFSDSLAHSFPFHSMLHDDSLSNILLNYYKSRKFHRSTVELDTLIATLVGIRNNFHVAFRDFKSNFPLS